MSRPAQALIDVGSNSVVLMVAQHDGRAWQRRARRKATLRLGAHIVEEGNLCADAEARLAQLLLEYVDEAKGWNAALQIAATASLRNVTNGSDVAARLTGQLGHEVEILSAAEEAEFALRGVWAAEGYPDAPLVVVDVGGGSSEVAWGQQGRVQAYRSMPIGSVRLAAECCPTDPVLAEQIDAMHGRIDSLLDGWTEPEQTSDFVYACSGSIRRLLAMKAGASGHLSRADLRSLIAMLSACPTRAQRLELPGIDPDRCDVLLPAALIHHALAERMNWSGFRLSAGGLRLGLLERSRD